MDSGDVVAYATLAIGYYYGWLGFVDIVILTRLWNQDYIGAVGVAALGCSAGFMRDGHEHGICTRVWGDGVLTCECADGVPEGIGKVESLLGTCEGFFENGKREGFHEMNFIDGSYGKVKFEGGVRNGTGLYLSKNAKLKIDFTYRDDFRDGEWYMIHSDRKFTLLFDMGRIVGGVVVEKDGSKYDALVSCKVLKSKRALKSVREGFKKAYGSVVVNNLKKYDPLKGCEDHRRQVEEMLDALTMLTEW